MLEVAETVVYPSAFANSMVGDVGHRLGTGHREQQDSEECLPAHRPALWRCAPLVYAAPMLGGLVLCLIVAAERPVGATLSDPAVPLEAKREALAAAAPLADFELIELLRRVQPAQAQRALCEEHRARLPEMAVHVDAESSFGVPLQAVILVDGVPDRLTPGTVMLPACATSVTVRYAETGETREVAVSGDPATRNDVNVRFGDRTAAWVVGVTGDVAGVTPGWGDGAQVWPSGGGRLDYWGEHFHFSAAVRLGTFGYRWLVKPPVLPVADLFAGVVFASGSEQLRVYYGVDLGLWSVACATARAIGALAFGRHFVTLAVDLHLYPIFVAGPRAGLYARVPIDNFVFWGGELAWGMRL